MNTPLKDFALLLPGGGSSTRFGGGSKLLHPLNGLPVFLHAPRRLAGLFPAGHILMAIPEESTAVFESASREYLPDVKIRFIPGGKSRMESVRNLVQYAEKLTACDFVAVHDAARPLILPETVLACAAECRKSGCALICHKITDTLKESLDGEKISRTVPREFFWAAETPQMFRLENFKTALEKAILSGDTFTDDVQVMERFSEIPVSIVQNTLPNFKITYASDIVLCEAALKLQENSFRQ